MDSSGGISPAASALGQTSEARHEQMKKNREAAFSAAANLFNESPEELKKELASGKSLSDIAAEKGVSADDLNNAISKALKEANSAASDDQIANITKMMVSGHHHHHAKPPEQAGDQESQPASAPPGSTLSVMA